jgi:hypothetical protein
VDLSRDFAILTRAHMARVVEVTVTGIALVALVCTFEQDEVHTRCEIGAVGRYDLVVV